ncbi:MAG: synthetase [Thermoleophilia bacterium]|nr:synthetase [Thermoleophilia bacterium]
MRIALCQLNPTVGDVDGNAALVVDAARRAHAAGADLAVFPEQVLSGYPAEDLWLKRHFLERCRSALERLAPELPLPCLVGYPEHVDGSTFNAAAYVVGGAVAATYRKQHLPNYAVFDEHRWFVSDDEALVVEVPVAEGEPVAVGVTICEDAWVERGPVVQAAGRGAQVVVNLSASPWRLDRTRDRERIVSDRAREAGVWFALCNQACGQDELVFDGHSLAAAPDGTVVARGAEFAEDLVVVEVGQGAPVEPAPVRELQGLDAEAWAGLSLGLADYVRKNGFRSVILGLSGGIDSGLVLALAVDALGADRVHAVTMPSRFSSSGTLGDAHAQAQRLGVHIHEVAIEPIVQAFDAALAGPFGGAPRDVTEENLQARVRGTLLMAFSNKQGHLVLATGNKSELSVGYATLYGDMNGGFAPLKDVFKTRVFRLARWRNDVAAAAGEDPVVPPSVIDRPPSAELSEDQRDSDSLPDYDTLDGILSRLVDEDDGVEDVVAAGFDADVVARIQRMVDRAEYKRRQAPPGVRVTDKAFGRDRRVPITNAFDGRAAAAALTAAPSPL